MARWLSFLTIPALAVAVMTGYYLGRHHGRSESPVPAAGRTVQGTSPSDSRRSVEGGDRLPERGRDQGDGATSLGESSGRRPTPAPEVDCPPCTCPPPRECPQPQPRECPPTSVVCRGHLEAAGALQRDLEATRKSLEMCRDGGPQGRYEGSTASDRRVMAAREKNLLIEFPSWGEDLTMSDLRAAELGLAPEERLAVEETYRTFREELFRQLQGMYGDLVGDPEAGQDSTINALIHNIMGLSPKEACQERILAIVSALSNGTPLPPSDPALPACERAVLLLFAAVDGLEKEVAETQGEMAAKAIWGGGSSSFTYSTSSSSDAPEAE
jgi:hypothetical protein